MSRFEDRTVIAPASHDRRPRLMVLEDDQVTRSMIARYFANDGFDVQEAGSAAECRALLRRGTVDLIFADIHLPDANGIALAQEIRAESPVGIIFVTQQDNEVDRVVGLETAGDDYVTKPVNLRELMARARALLRRRRLDSAPGNRRVVMTFGPYILDLTRRELSISSGGQISLTRGEFDLLAALAEAGGRPLYRDFLAEVVSSRPGESDTRTVDTLVSRLRRKLNHQPDGGTLIVTVTGIGYRFGLAVDSA
ncbi:DNA-binding response regulator [Magnetospirillum sp. ME-1]|uniref:response regulator transcription factor n=1 Tax=Magnetospirillum sp. ME-1 TaxID=1639348 RepID=UPI000A17B390|nr:response regulator transcription factor [Magnetospirillum sp. ME-1]ARJ65148.1 DNA-binding response regulator [Magnetospirillum sp. ME-1]